MTPKIDCPFCQERKSVKDALVIAIAGQPKFISCIPCLPTVVGVNRQDVPGGQIGLSIIMQGNPGPKKPASPIIVAKTIPNQNDSQLLNKFKQENQPKRIILKK